MSHAIHEVFVACLPGLEPVVASECEDLGMRIRGTVRSGTGGVPGNASAAEICALNVRLGAASHVLLRVAEFGARHFSELRRRAASPEWRVWLGDDVPFSVSATARRSKLIHTGAIVERVGAAIADVVGRGPVERDDAVPILVRMSEDRCTLSIDTSGRPLHEQGWRLEAAKAPLREDLAHALVVASGWEPGTPFVDPFCGSGTLPIVAARRALGIPPGAARPFAGERLSPLLDEHWRAARERRERAPSAPIFGSDRNEGAIAIATRNAGRADVAEAVQFDVAAVSEAPGFGVDAPTGAVVTNLPFGRRIDGGSGLASLYQRLGTRLAAMPADWRIALLAADRRLALRTGVSLRSAFLTNHGGIRVRGLVSDRR